MLPYVESALLVELNNGDSLAWLGPAGQEWGHIFFVPIGFLCVRFRSRWDVDIPDDTKGGLERDRSSDGDGNSGSGGSGGMSLDGVAITVM